MFSPPRLAMPAFAARSHGVAPFGSVWSKKPRAAMSSLKDSASFVSELFAARALQPTLARSSLTSFSTSASAAARADTVTGAEVFAGALGAVRLGVVFGLDGVALGAGGFFDAVFDGVGDAEAEEEAEADGLVGDPERSVSRLVDEPLSLPVPALPAVPPCSVAVLLGESAACTLSPPLLVLPPSR